MVMETIFADRLRRAMEIRGISASELANLAGVSKASISEYLAGKYDPKTKNAHRLAQVLHVSMGYLEGRGELREDLNIEDVPVFSQIEKEGLSESGGNIERWERLNDERVSFAMRMPDDGMEKARICRGDIVYVQGDTAYENGDIVAANTESEDFAIIRRYYLLGRNIVLKPEQDGMEEKIYPMDKVFLLGRVVGGRYMIR